MLRTPFRLAKFRQLSASMNGSGMLARLVFEIDCHHPAALRRDVYLAYLPSAAMSTRPESQSTQLPPRKPRRLLRKFLLALIGSSAVVAGLLYTSKYFRDLVVSEYPPSKPVFSRIESLIGGWYDEQPTKTPPKPITGDSVLPFLTEKPDAPTDDVRETPIAEPAEESHVEQLKNVPTVDDFVQMTHERAHAVPAERITTDIAKGISDATSSVQAAIMSLESLSSATRNHIEGLREAMRAGDDSSRSKEKKWEHVSRLAALKDKAETRAGEAVQEATQYLDALRESLHQLEQSESFLDSDLFPQGIRSLGKLRYDLDGSILEVRKLQNELSMLMRYRDLASKTHETLLKDLTSIHENTDLDRASKDGSSLSIGELNSLIVVAHNQIGKLKAILAEVEEKEKVRLISALESQRRVDEQLIADYLKRELEQERNEFRLQRFNWELELREAIEQELRKTRAQYSDHLSKMLRLKQDEMEHQFTFRLREALAQEKVAFTAALSGWTKRMEAIEDVVDGRAELDRIAKETQALWIACEALACNLSSSVPTVGTGLSGSATTGPLSDYVEAIREAASTGSHPFALAILEQIPQEVSKQGVWIERGLKERFEKVYRVCRRVALVDETSGSLYTYMLSWLQSALTLDVFTNKYLRTWFKSPSIPQLTGESELADKPNPPELDTFSLLRSAKAALTTAKEQNINDDEQIGGDDSDDGIELAVRLLGQLRGQARVVASDWLDDARRYLETKQAVHALLAYAAARGMSTYEKRL
ncbi:MICOS complex subunit Mic60 [Clonorchis sinensis]|uniref:MICOS complex subunit MIC60 n=1 Tax=Clonorchis sinensis TaxID=79923 RepID=A0A8T1MRF3_CLOSI|nr:MICOS complex subunit Mic60 [Clonorchis sinensis]